MSFVLKFVVSKNTPCAIMNQNHSFPNNFLLFNNFTAQKPNPSKGKIHPETHYNHQSVDKIMDFFNTRYRNILPNRPTTSFDFKNTFFPLDKAQLVELLHQMDIFVQLLVQVKWWITRRSLIVSRTSFSPQKRKPNSRATSSWWKSATKSNLWPLSWQKCPLIRSPCPNL